ncbi:4617_t:CDS:2 [Funneliformis geosporum]|nr:4617_t:CDS:2 [Funneliformis geosporum]
MNGMKDSLNSRLDSPPTRYIIAFCFVVDTEIESAIVVKGEAGMSIAELKDTIYEKKKKYFEKQDYDPSDLHL